LKLKKHLQTAGKSGRKVRPEEDYTETGGKFAESLFASTMTWGVYTNLGGKRREETKGGAVGRVPEKMAERGLGMACFKISPMGRPSAGDSAIWL